jgi:hypothetical protein
MSVRNVSPRKNWQGMTPYQRASFSPLLMAEGTATDLYTLVGSIGQIMHDYLTGLLKASKQGACQLLMPGSGLGPEYVHRDIAQK